MTNVSIVILCTPLSTNMALSSFGSDRRIKNSTENEGFLSVEVKVLLVKLYFLKDFIGSCLKTALIFHCESLAK